MPAFPNGHARNPVEASVQSPEVARHAGFLQHASKLLSGDLPLSEDPGAGLVFVYKAPSDALLARAPGQAQRDYGRVFYDGDYRDGTRRARAALPDGRAVDVVELTADLALELVSELTGRAHAMKHELTVSVADTMARKNHASPSRYQGYLQKQYDDLVKQLTDEMFRQKDRLKRGRRPEPSDGHVSDDDLSYADG